MKDEMCGDEDQRHLDIADQNRRDDLADHHLKWSGGHGEQVFHGAALTFTSNGEGRDHDHRHGEHHAHEARHDVVLGDGFRVVKGMHAQVHGAVRARQKRERPLEVVLQGAVDQRAQGANGIAGRRRVRRIRFHQHGGAVAAQEIAGETLRNIDDELHLAARQHAPGLGLGMHHAGEFEVTAVLDGVQQRAALRSIVGNQHGGGQVLGVRVDGEPEQNELHHGNADHHAEGEPVAPHLDELLHDHRPQPGQGEVVARAHGE